MKTLFLIIFFTFFAGLGLCEAQACYEYPTIGVSFTQHARHRTLRSDSANICRLWINSQWFDGTYASLQSVPSTFTPSAHTHAAGDIISPPWSIIDSGSVVLSGVSLQTQYIVSHGLGYTPKSIWVQPRSADAAALSYIDNFTSTTFRITFLTVPVLGTNNIDFDWFSLR